MLVDDRSFMINGSTIEPSSSEWLNSASLSLVMRQAQKNHQSSLKVERYTRSDITTMWHSAPEGEYGVNISNQIATGVNSSVPQ